MFSEDEANKAQEELDALYTLAIAKGIQTVQFYLSEIKKALAHPIARPLEATNAFDLSVAIDEFNTRVDEILRNENRQIVARLREKGIPLPEEFDDL